MAVLFCSYVYSLASQFFDLKYYIFLGKVSPGALRSC